MRSATVTRPPPPPPPFRTTTDSARSAVPSAVVAAPPLARPPTRVVLLDSSTDRNRLSPTTRGNEGCGSLVTTRCDDTSTVHVLVDITPREFPSDGFHSVPAVATTTTTFRSSSCEDIRPPESRPFSSSGDSVAAQTAPPPRGELAAQRAAGATAPTSLASTPLDSSTVDILAVVGDDEPPQPAAAFVSSRQQVQQKVPSTRSTVARAAVSVQARKRQWVREPSQGDGASVSRPVLPPPSQHKEVVLSHSDVGGCAPRHDPLSLWMATVEEKYARERKSQMRSTSEMNCRSELVVSKRVASPVSNRNISPLRSTQPAAIHEATAGDGAEVMAPLGATRHDPSMLKLDVASPWSPPIGVRSSSPRAVASPKPVGASYPCGEATAAMTPSTSLAMRVALKKFQDALSPTSLSPPPASFASPGTRFGGALEKLLGSRYRATGLQDRSPGTSPVSLEDGPSREPTHVGDALQMVDASPIVFSSGSTPQPLRTSATDATPLHRSAPRNAVVGAGFGATSAAGAAAVCDETFRSMIDIAASVERHRSPRARDTYSRWGERVVEGRDAGGGGGDPALAESSTDAVYYAPPSPGWHRAVAGVTSPSPSVLETTNTRAAPPPQRFDPQLVVYEASHLPRDSGEWIAPPQQQAARARAAAPLPPPSLPPTAWTPPGVQQPSTTRDEPESHNGSSFDPL